MFGGGIDLSSVKLDQTMPASLNFSPGSEKAVAAFRDAVA